MNNIEVINIAPEREVLLGFLRPTYTISDSPAVTKNFIVHRNIKTKAEREGLEVYYQNGMFISTQIFDEMWDDNRIIKEVVSCSHKFFKNRKTKLVTTPDTFNQDCINFLYGIDSIEEDAEIQSLWDSFGSTSFIKNWCTYTSKVPYQQAVAAMVTFISKIKRDSASVFYKKKAMLYEDIIKSNKMKALDAYNCNTGDTQGLAECKLFMDLIAKQ